MADDPKYTIHFPDPTKHPVRARLVLRLAMIGLMIHAGLDAIKRRLLP